VTGLSTPKEDLQHYLLRAREALLWKLDGLSEYDLRRPLVPTGTNLLGLVKHAAYTEAEYLGVVFGRPFPEPLPDVGPDAELNADMWATVDETSQSIADFYLRVCTHGDRTIADLDLEAEGFVPWWREGHQVATLRLVLVHLIAETNRHAGHADILREIIDGAAGLNPAFSNLPDVDDIWWSDYSRRLAALARHFGGPEAS
jgi:hypothetical protein